MRNDPYENSASRSSLINRLLADRYEVLESLGDGPLLSAYRARDRQMNRIVTLKTIRPEFAARPELIEALETGLGTVLGLSHPGIARVYDVGTDDSTGLLYIVEEYVRGIDLKERIRRTAPFQLAAATDIAIALAEALEAAHARDVAHGDVRPQNIVFGPENQVKIGNFGVATAQNKLAATQPELLLKVVGYIAPDAARSAEPTPSGDLYSLGCLLFEMLTGDMPYTGDSALQIALKHAQEPIPSPREINRGVPPALDGLVQKMLGKTPTTRYASATELLRDLRAIREALKFGKSLNWTPLERENSVDRKAVPMPPVTSERLSGPSNDVVRPAQAIVDVSATVPKSGGVAPPSQAIPVSNDTLVAPIPAEIEAQSGELRSSSPAQGEPVRPSPRPKAIHWLTFLNLFLVLVILGAGYTLWRVVFDSKPDSTVLLPNLVGKTVEEAKGLAEEQKFEILIVEKSFREKEAMNVIYKQSIPPGKPVIAGRKVALWVSKGPRMAIVPNVQEMSLPLARRTLESQGLVLGSYKAEYDPLVEKGNVISQAIEPGSNRPRGTPVDLVISKGVEPLPTPEPFENYSPELNPVPEDTFTPEPIAPEKPRYFRIVYPQAPIPEGDEPHRIRVDVFDDRGPRTVQDVVKKPGEQVRIDALEVVGEDFVIKIYDNDELSAEVTKDSAPPSKFETP